MRGEVAGRPLGHNLWFEMPVSVFVVELPAVAGRADVRYSLRSTPVEINGRPERTVRAENQELGERCGARRLAALAAGRELHGHAGYDVLGRVWFDVLDQCVDFILRRE